MKKKSESPQRVSVATRKVIIGELGRLMSQRDLEALNGDFGFFPISDRKAPVYRAAASALCFYLRTSCEHLPDLAHISECKGIYNRVARQDQWDWATVQICLKVHRNTARKVANFLKHLRFAIKANQDTSQIRGKLRDFGVHEQLDRLLRCIDDAHNGIGKGITSAPRWKNSGPGTEPNPRDPTHHRRPLDLRALREAHESHEQLVGILAQLLRDNGFRPEESVHVDLFVRLKWAPAIFEVKTLTCDNEVAQMRKAVAQLLEYRFRYDQNDATLWILYATEPQDRTMLVDFPRSLGFYVTWPGDFGFEGPDGDKLLINFRGVG